MESTGCWSGSSQSSPAPTASGHSRLGGSVYAGETVPDQLVREERAARAAALVLPALLARVREAYDGPLLILKGPELTRVYPDGARRLGDLDLLAGDPEAAQEALLAGGFQEKPLVVHPDYSLHHHLHPLVWPDIPLPVEIHRRVAWPRGLASPSNTELFAAALPAGFGMEGILTPDPRQHAVLLASHSWREVPLQKLRAFVDVLAFDGRRCPGGIGRDRAPLGFRARLVFDARGSRLAPARW